MLGKIPLRVIGRNKAQFMGIILLVFLASLSYALFSILVTNVDANYGEFVSDYQQESFHFVVSKPIDTNALEKEWGITLEERFFKDVNLNDKTLRLFSLTEKVNKPLASPGRLPTPGEVAIDPNFAKANKMNVGDSLQMGGRTFRISGFLYLPDIIYITRNEQDLLPDPVHFGIGVMNLEDLKELGVSSNVHYYMAQRQPSDMAKFKEELNSKYRFLSFQEKPDNFRIIVTEKKIEGARPMAYVLSGFILIVSSMILFIVMRRLIQSMHVEIGTLYALGYSFTDIANVYMRFPLFVWLFGAVTGGVAGYLLAAPFTEFYVSFLSIPIVVRAFPLKELALAILMPLVFVAAAGYFAVNELLRKPPVQIIRGEQEKGFAHRLNWLFLEKLSFRHRVMLKYGLFHISREIILVLGVAFATLLLLYSVTAQNSLTSVLNETYTNVFRYNQMYLLNTILTDNTYPGAERFSTLGFNVQGTKTKVAIYGIEKNSSMVVLRGLKGSVLDVDGLVIAKSLADKLGLKKDDELKLIGQLDGKLYSLKVADIADLYVGNSGYMSLETFNKTFGLPSGSFMGLFSQESLDIPTNMILTSMDKDYLIKVFEESASTIDQIIRIMVLVSFLLSFTVIYVLSSLTVSENRKPIGVFKILGYSDSELGYILLGFNNLSFIVGFLLGIPLYNTLINFMMNSLLKDVDFSLKMTSSFFGGLVSFLLLLAAFLLSKYLSRKRILSISPSLILKEQAE